METLELNRLLERGRLRAEELEPRLAALLVPILNQAADQAARRFPETATNLLTAAALKKKPPKKQSQWVAPSPDELVDVDALVAALLTKTEPVRRAFVERVMTAALEAAGLDWDVTNPFTAKVLAQSASQVTHIAETTRANVMRIVASAYKEGLSIPHTAEAIRAGMKAATPARATLIARTELSGAVNGGSLAAVQIVNAATGGGAGLSKMWLTAPGAPHPRHEDYPDLDHQVVPLDGYFQVGDAELQFPGDPNGPPEEVCNCLAGARSRIPRAPPPELPDSTKA